MSTSAQPQPSPSSRVPASPAWMSLAKQASVEQDPARMTQLISQLLAAIDDSRRVPPPLPMTEGGVA